MGVDGRHCVRFHDVSSAGRQADVDKSYVENVLIHDSYQGMIVVEGTDNSKVAKRVSIYKLNTFGFTTSFI